MTDFSDYTKNALMNWCRGTTFPAAPANVYVALFNGDPTSAGTGGTEVTTTVRVAGRLAAGFAAISSGQIANAAEIDFGNSAGDVTITHWALYTAASAGNQICQRALSTPNSILTGGPVLIPAGSLTYKPE